MFGWKRKKRNLGKTKSIEIAAPSLHDLSLPDRIQFYDDHYRIDHLYCCTLVVDAIPEIINMGWFNNITNLGGVTVSVSNIPNKRREANEKVNGWRSIVGSELILAKKAGNTSAVDTLEVKYNYYRQLLRDISLKRNNIVTVTVTVMITAKSYEEMDKKKSRVKDLLANTNSRTLYKRQHQGLKSILPFIDTNVPEYHDVTVANAACLAPLISTDFSHPATGNAIYFGENATGSPAFLDLFIGPPRLFGPHMFLTGMTRVGKSYTVKGMTARSRALGIKSVIIDPEGEYGNLCKSLGGVLIRFNPGMECMFNPFDVEPDYNEETGTYYIDLLSKAGEIISLFSGLIEIMGERMTAEERALASEAIRQEYQSCDITSDPQSLFKEGTGKKEGEKYSAGLEYKSLPTISSFIERLKKLGAHRLATILIPFTKGHEYGFFDGQGIGSLFDAPIIVFDLKGLNNKFAVTYANLVMLSWTLEKFIKKHREVKKRVVCDECWMFLLHPDTAEFLSTVSRRGAKYNTSLLLATQSFREFMTKEGETIINMCDTRFYLKMQSTDAKGLGQMFDIPPDVIEQIKSFEPGQGLLKVGNEMAVINFRGLPFEESFIRSDPEAIIRR
ncbi:VirB4 family type IV secretion system protein [Desulforamulus ruminis]|uniref:VirB4 family type IV secretion system protein n=1 Tax=Desulforamulus ruminis TaxID=1564 RepID=UPI002356AE27|nr:ATP-binding protein [Desulforamulus ruminis]